MYDQHLKASDETFNLLALVPAIAFLLYVILFTTYQRKKVEAGLGWKSRNRVGEAHEVGRWQSSLRHDELISYTNILLLSLRVMQVQLNEYSPSPLVWVTLPSWR